MKTITEELEAALAEVAKMQGESKALADRVAALELDAKSNAEKYAAESAAVIKAHESAISDMTAKLDAANAAIEAAQKERDTAISERDEARKALKNPAFATAAVRGDEKPVADGATPADAPKESLVAKMKAISDPRERAAFYHANKDAIQAELK